MSVDYDTFLQWAIARFGEENIKFKKGGREICTHSFFPPLHGMEEDYGYHLWMNPDGGKKELEHGAYRCWKTDEMGSLVSLVAMLDGCPFDESEEMLCGSLSLRSLEQKVDEFFRNKGFGVPDDLEPLPARVTEVDLPEYCILISKLAQGSFHRNLAEKYLKSRKLPITGLYYCYDGKYKNRIVIPYYNQDGDLIWFNARTLSNDKDILRYKKPEGEGLSQDNVLYFPEWPPPRSKVYLTEGEFDAMVLRLAGLYSCACGGKHLSGTQIEVLRDYQVVMAFDNDGRERDSGKQATIDVGDSLLSIGFLPRYVRPPVGYKDWNALLEKTDLSAVKEYVLKNEKPYTPDTASILRGKKVW